MKATLSQDLIFSLWSPISVQFLGQPLIFSFLEFCQLLLVLLLLPSSFLEVLNADLPYFLSTETLF
jgi:hypothetical protein